MLLLFNGGLPPRLCENSGSLPSAAAGWAEISPSLRHSANFASFRDGSLSGGRRPREFSHRLDPSETMLRLL